MSKLILVAGATGNLGQKICRELLKRNVPIRAIVRSSTSEDKKALLAQLGVEVLVADYADQQSLIAACTDVSCVVSALAGLRDVIVDHQLALLKAAVAAGVPRFIPSDFCTDFTQMLTGENRNFDLRKEFQEQLDKSPIQATSIFNGAFSDILRYNTPLFNVPEKTIASYEGKADWKIDFTTMDDTAAFTAEVALDDTAPRFLRIASFCVSPNDLLHFTEQASGGAFTIKQMGTMDGFSAYNKMQRAANPEGENQLYSKWQQAQYLYSMFAAHHLQLDNDRYSQLTWSPLEANLPIK